MYRQVHKEFPWITFDTIDLEFNCSRCNTVQQASKKTIESGKGEEEATAFAEKHKSCS